MPQPLRILHLPGRTPYARKLRAPGFGIINDTCQGSLEVPRDASFEWLAAQPSWGFFDLLHLQSLELTRLDAIERVLQRCELENKGVIFTLHDIGPLFPDPAGDFPLRIKVACRVARRVITLTNAAATEVERRFGVAPEKVVVVPHGPVLAVSHDLWQKPAPRNAVFTIGMFGGVRPNRTFLTPAVNALHGLDQREVCVRLLTRGLNPIELAPTSEGFQLSVLAAADPRLSLELRPFPSDDEVAEFVQSLDLLVLPYLHGTHSGQLELALDLRTPVVAPRLGCYHAQWELHASYVPEPFWFSCAPADPYSYGGPLLGALRAAHAEWREGRLRPEGAVFRAIRALEHEEILRAHGEIYAAAAAR